MIEKCINIAVIVAGIDEEYQNNIISGINAYSYTHKINVSYFASFGGVLQNGRYDRGEYNIYNLVNLSLFDGVILMTNTVNSDEEKTRIYERVKEAGIPVVVFDCSDLSEDFYTININNFKAMEDMVRHIVNDHGIKSVNYISGPLNNPEAAARYDAFMSVMAENNITVEKKRVYFGEFRGVDGKKAVSEFITSGLKMPQAIICANDAMALTAITALEQHGYHVPQDILVTGFDNTYKARNFCPELSSVKRPLYDVGAKACEIIRKIVNGETVEKNAVLDAEAVFSESCGCVSVELVDGFDEYKKKTFKSIDDCNVHISILNRMTTNLAEAETIDEIVYVIGNFVEEIQCEKFYICLCSDWQSSFKDESEREISRTNTYSKNMTCPLSWENGKLKKPIPLFKSRNMFPVPLENGGNVSYFLPLHFRERCLGYCLMVNSEFPIKSLLCHTLVMNISNSIENVRKLYHLNNAIAELDKLYVIDPLCNVYNRNGFIRESAAPFKEAVENHEKIMIAFIDMDGLKFINDSYGHKEGDYAIQQLAAIIKENCVNNDICARFGGDEFIVFAADVEEEDGNAFEARIKFKINELNQLICKPYEISASMGVYVDYASDDMTLFKMITKADEVMYEQKKRSKNSRYLRRS